MDLVEVREGLRRRVSWLVEMSEVVGRAPADAAELYRPWIEEMRCDIFACRGRLKNVEMELGRR